MKKIVILHIKHTAEYIPDEYKYKVIDACDAPKYDSRDYTTGIVGLVLDNKASALAVIEECIQKKCALIEDWSVSSDFNRALHIKKYTNEVMGLSGLATMIAMSNEIE